MAHRSHAHCGHWGEWEWDDGFVEAIDDDAETLALALAEAPPVLLLLELTTADGGVDKNAGSVLPVLAPAA